MSPERTTALIVAAGTGARMGDAVPKQFASVGGKPVLAHAIGAFLAHPAIDAVQVVIGPGQESLFAAAVGDRPLPPPAIGGATRRESVAAGLAAIQGDGRVLIHDAARPFLPAAVIDRLLDAIDHADGAVPVLPVADTLALGGPALGDTISRDGLVRIQTPQAFRLPAIRAAHHAWNSAEDATDDAQMVRAAGMTVATVAGDPALDKLTYAGDLLAARQRVAPRYATRVGLGFDVHAFEPGDHVQLGGIPVPHAFKLKGHSDADVLLHAITDALLGAVGEGDIGDHFPPSDPQWKDAASDHFLIHARDLIAAQGGAIEHVDATIICEAPRIGPHRAAIRCNVAGLLRLPESRVSVKATTTERLGFTGRGEGIAAQAVATIRMPETE